MRRHRRGLHVGPLHVFTIHGQWYIDWRPDQPGRRWRSAASRHMWRPLRFVPTRTWRVFGVTIDWYAQGND